MFQKLKQYKDLREGAKKAQNVLETITAHADAAGGKVGVVVNGNQEIMTIDIDESLLSAENKAKIQDGVIEAHKKATKKLQREMFMKMRSGELEMPDIGGLGGGSN